MATLRDMTAQQKQAAELLATIKGLKRSRSRNKPTPPSEKPQTPRDAYERHFREAFGELHRPGQGVHRIGAPNEQHAHCARIHCCCQVGE